MPEFLASRKPFPRVWPGENSGRGKIGWAGKESSPVATVIAAFPSAGKARSARRELAQAGLPRDRMQLVGPQDWFDARAALAEPEQNVIAGRAGEHNPALGAATLAGDALTSARPGGDLPGVERQWLNHVLLVVSDLQDEKVAGITTALRQLGAEHVLAR